MTTTPHPILEFSVDTFYGPVQAHFGLSLRSGAGEIVCLLGGNASGKSTTMKTIMGLVEPDRRRRPVRRHLDTEAQDAADRPARHRPVLEARRLFRA